MSARVWTREELDRVHPLPGDWEWMRDGATTVGGVPMWSAVILDDDYGETEVSSIICVDQEGRLHCELGSDDTHTADVALAVILTSKGLDSSDAMTAAAYQAGRAHERLDVVDFITSPPGRVPEWLQGQIAELSEAIKRGRHEGWAERLYKDKP